MRRRELRVSMQNILIGAWHLASPGEPCRRWRKKNRIFLPMPMIREKEKLKNIHDMTRTQWPGYWSGGWM